MSPWVLCCRPLWRWCLSNNCHDWHVTAPLSQDREHSRLYNKEIYHKYPSGMLQFYWQCNHLQLHIYTSKRSVVTHVSNENESVCNDYHFLHRSMNYEKVSVCNKKSSQQIVEDPPKLHPCPTNQSRPCQPQAGFGLVRKKVLKDPN